MVISVKAELENAKCRLDKWLWAARFFKTRNLATAAIETGKVHVDGDRVKPAKEMQVGQIISIKTRDFEIEVSVCVLSSIRRGAAEAATLYKETLSSINNREKVKVIYGKRDRGAGRPTKQQLREIKKFTDADYS